MAGLPRISTKAADPDSLGAASTPIEKERPELLTRTYRPVVVGTSGRLLDAPWRLLGSFVGVIGFSWEEKYAGESYGSCRQGVEGTWRRNKME